MYGIGLFSGISKAQELLGEFSIITAILIQNSSPEGAGNAPKSCLPTAIKRQKKKKKKKKQRREKEEE